MNAIPHILVFDSGLGGLTVLREIVKARPDARYTYVADDAFFPYGQHSEDAIIGRVVPLIGELIAAHAPDLVVIACNTASTLVLAHLRAAYKVPFVGTVPAIKPACAGSKTKLVSVLGTSGTKTRRFFSHCCGRSARRWFPTASLRSSSRASTVTIRSALAATPGSARSAARVFS